MILVTFCYGIEARWITRQPAVRIVRTAVGDRSWQTMEQLDDGGPDASLLIAVGFCGGVDPRLRTGQLFLARDVRHRGDEIAVDPDLLDRARRALNAGSTEHHTGCCASVDHVLHSGEKRALAADGVSAVDMEAGPLARWAADRGIPFLELRVVLDPAGTDVPFSADRPLWMSALRHPIAAARTTSAAFRAGRILGTAVDTVVDAFAGRSDE